MTTPMNRPTDDELEVRLQASFDRAARRAEDDLADGLLAGEAIDRGRRRRGVGAAWRTGLVFAAVAVLGLGTLWVGGRPSPSPSPVPSGLAAASPSAGTAQGASPSIVDGLPTPVVPSSDATQVPQLPLGDPWPTTLDGQPVYPVGGAAEQYIATATADTPFLVSGWQIGLAGGGGCSDFSLGSPAPNGVYFRDCVGAPLYASPDGGTSLKYFYALTVLTGSAGIVHLESTQVDHEIYRVHIHDKGCSTADCATKPVLDEILLTGERRLNPAILAASQPPQGVSMQQAVATALETVRQGYGTGYPIVVSVSLGTAAVLGDLNAHGKAASTWEWKIVASTPDGLSVATAYVDYLTGLCDHSGTADGGSLSQ